MTLGNKLSVEYGINGETFEFCMSAAAEAEKYFAPFNETAEYNSLRVLSAMRKNNLSDAHFTSVTGYGYNDAGRDATEKIYADIFGHEAGLVRPQLISGTHALYVALSANLNSGDTLLLPAGKPYDTLCKVIGLNKTGGSLAERGVNAVLIGLTADGGFDYEKIGNAVKSRKIKMAAVQRSRGYSLRRSFLNAETERLVSFIKKLDGDIVCMVDNCYGEFVETSEPGFFGADLTVGSLIKNPGGGISPAGGYICGSEKLVAVCADRLTAPGLGKNVGPTLGLTPRVLQGLFAAPGVVKSALKAAVFASVIYKRLGFTVSPEPDEARTDIVQTIKFNDKKLAVSFVQGIQRGSPVDAFVTPVPGPTPGYDCDVIMAAGTFTQGSSIELSADAPLREPYAAFLQGGLSYEYAKLGIMIATDFFIKENGIRLNNAP